MKNGTIANFLLACAWGACCIVSFTRAEASQKPSDCAAAIIYAMLATANVLICSLKRKS